MTLKPDPSATPRPLPYRKLTGSQYRAIADQVKQWNPGLWDEWAELEREVESWSKQEAIDREEECKERSKKIRFQIIDFLTERGIAKDHIEAMFWMKYLHSCCMEDHGLPISLSSHSLPPG